ncbi:MAG: bifunctional diaminohydroxyphosphoribosylaminopyrimidine deaminase/5-amino-6-(5-phosphoribosylamino)uracil reductase RibD [Paracoccaceae bacterium]
MSGEEDRRFLRLALSLAARGLGNVWPNPAVGCVIVRDGRILGRGWTQPGGRPHAETMALAQAGTAARGATAYLTLEPCAHFGQTPPCADALAGAGIARVVSALQDPDPRVSGRGHARLAEGGAQVEVGLLGAEAEALQKGFLSRIRKGRPMLTLKLATTLDGRIATASGESRWITGEAARAAVHTLRATHDAVMIGGGTARADDPLLTIRTFTPLRPAVRIVVSAGLNLSPDSALVRSATEAPLWLAYARDSDTTGWGSRGVRLIPVARSGAGLDPASLLAALGEAGLTRVLCEGGAALAAALLAAGLVDELVLFTAGLAFGAGGLAAIAALPDTRLANTPRFRLAEVREIGGDVMQRWVAGGA